MLGDRAASFGRGPETLSAENLENVICFYHVSTHESPALRLQSNSGVGRPTIQNSPDHGRLDLDKGRALYKYTSNVILEGTFAFEKVGTVGSNSTVGEGVSNEEYDFNLKLVVSDKLSIATHEYALHECLNRIQT